MDSELAQVVDGERETGFLVSVVTSYSNPWTLIMDASLNCMYRSSF